MYDRREDMPDGRAHTLGIRRKPIIQAIPMLYRRLSANALSYLYLYRACPLFGKPTRVHTRLLACRLPADVIFPIPSVGTESTEVDYEDILADVTLPTPSMSTVSTMVAYAASLRMPFLGGCLGMPSLRSCIPGYGVADILADVIVPIPKGYQRSLNRMR